MIRFLRVFFIVVLIALATMLGIARAEEIIVLKPASEVNSPSVKLSDVFSGVPVALDRAIATAPAPGKSVTYDVNVLKKLAVNNRLDWQPESLADRAVITRAATKISQDMIESAVLDKLKSEKLNGKIEIMFDNKALEINLPADRAPKFTLNNFDFDALNKRFRSELVAETGATPLVLPVTGRVVVKRDVPMLARRLERGMTIGESDIAWITVATDKLTNDVITDPSQLIGRELRHDLASGQPISARAIIPARLVTRGSLVTMKIQTPYMTVTAQGRALQDGAVGDVVRVTNTQSNRTVEGTVEGAGVIRIHTAQRLASAQ